VVRKTKAGAVRKREAGRDEQDNQEGKTAPAPVDVLCRRRVGRRGGKVEARTDGIFRGRRIQGGLIHPRDLGLLGERKTREKGDTRSGQ